MQEDANTCNRPYVPVNFMVVRVKSKRDRLWEVSREDIVLEAATGGQRFAQREITKTIWLNPVHDKKNVHYIIVPNVEVDGGSKKEEERPFYLRIFASEQVDLVKLPETIEQVFPSKWSTTTSGGRRVHENGKENQFWCRNPQFFLNITKPTHLKIIIRKKLRKKNRFPFGMTITKALPPTTPQEAKILQGKGQEGKKLPTSMTVNGVTYA